MVHAHAMGPKKWEGVVGIGFVGIGIGAQTNRSSSGGVDASEAASMGTRGRIAAVAEEAIAAIRHLVPTDAASEASMPQDDDLFV